MYSGSACSASYNLNSDNACGITTAVTKLSSCVISFCLAMDQERLQGSFSWTDMKVKVKCTLVEALRLCTGRTAHRGSRGIALLFNDQRHYKGVRGQRHSPVALYPQERPGTHCTGGWVGRRSGLDRCGKSRPHRDSIPVPSRP